MLTLTMPHREEQANEVPEGKRRNECPHEGACLPYDCGTKLLTTDMVVSNSLTKDQLRFEHLLTIVMVVSKCLCRGPSLPMATLPALVNGRIGEENPRPHLMPEEMRARICASCKRKFTIFLRYEPVRPSSTIASGSE